jgi:hypothetical protein
MWTTLALMSTLSWTPAQAGQLELKNARVTYGILGQERKDTAYLPGDMVILAFDIEGLKVAANGQVRYKMNMELTNAKGDSKYKTEPELTVAVNTLGSTRLPAFAMTAIGTDTEPGEYTMTVTVSDESNPKVPAKLPRKFQVKKPQFGIVRSGFHTVIYNDKGGVVGAQNAPPVGVPGQNLMFSFTVLGFELKGDKMEPNVSVTMEIQDESGKAVLDKPFTGEAKNIDDEAKKLRVIPFQLPIQLNRSGKFKVVVTAEDKHTGKTAKETLDLTVVEAK